MKTRTSSLTTVQMGRPSNDQRIPSLLAWDTDFFGFQIQKLVLSGCIDCDYLHSAVREADCTYLFSSETSAELEQLISSVGGKSYGSNVVYGKKASAGDGLWSDEFAIMDAVTPEMLSLAYAAGWNSRFLRDERFARQFKRFYAKWIENDMQQGEVIVFMDQREIPAGLITVKIDEECARIGILAVNSAVRRKGIGRKLLAFVEDRVARQCPGISLIVSTQGGNLPARALYERSGFSLKSETHVWHVWKPEVKGK